MRNRSSRYLNRVILAAIGLLCAGCFEARGPDALCSSSQILIGERDFPFEVSQGEITSPSSTSVFESRNTNSAEASYFLGGSGYGFYVASHEVNFWNYESVARKQFSEEVNRHFGPDKWSKPIATSSEIAMLSLAADDYRIGCFNYLLLEGSRKECRLVSRYGQYVSELEIRTDVSGLGAGDVATLMSKADATIRACVPKPSTR